MKENELRQASTCVICRRRVGETGLPLFWRVTFERFGVDLSAVRRQTGLAMVLGHAGLAAAMGPDEDMASRIGEPATVTVCESCAGADISVYLLAGMQ